MDLMFEKVDTYSPCTGCEHNCVYCYARPIAENKLRNTPKYKDGFKPAFHPETLKQSLSRNKTYFVCYDKKTEVLTKLGWKLIKNVKFNDEIATLNRENKFVEYQNPTSIIKEKYNDKIYKLKTKLIDLMVTKDHKMFVAKHPTFTSKNYTSDKSKWNYELVPAKDIYNKERNYNRFFKWKGKKIDTFILPAQYIISPEGKKTHEHREVEIPIKDWLEFLGYYIAEGSVNIIKRKYKYIVVIATDNKDRYMNDMLKSCKKIGGYLNRNVCVDKYGRIYIEDKRLAKYLEKLGKAYNKFIPRELLHLSKYLLKCLLTSAIKGDGNKLNSKSESFAYHTVSPQLADDIQEIALKCGYVSTINKTEPKKPTKIKSGRNKGHIIKSNYPYYRVSICTTSKYPNIYNRNRKSNIEKWVDYNDYVYCIEVPNNIIYVRRNGKPVWCGNCSMGDLWGNWFSLEVIKQVMDKCKKANQSNTFMFLTKNPQRYIEYFNLYPNDYQDNFILGCTIESNLDIPGVSKAPNVFDRNEAMKSSCMKNYRKFLCIEPIMYFTSGLVDWAKEINPEYIFVGYDNHNHHLTEPNLSLTLELIEKLERITEVRQKTIRKGWDEK